LEVASVTIGTIPFMTKSHFILLVLACAFVARVVAGLLLVDLNGSYYWEYGETAKNLNAGKGYSLYHFERETPSIKYDPESSPVPSAFMPPGYVVVIYLFLQIGGSGFRNTSLIIFQSVVGVVVVWTLYKLTSKYFDSKSAPFAAIIAAFLPEFVFACTSFTPTVLFHLGIVTLILMGYEVDLSTTNLRLFFIGVLSSSLIMLRSETLLFVVILIIIAGMKFGKRHSLTMGTVVVFSLLPWQARNYVTFDSPIPLTTSSGLNLFRGNNNNEIGAWSDEYIVKEARKIPHDQYYEVALNKLYSRRALEFIVKEPERVVKNFGNKLYSFWIRNSDDERSDHPLYFVPWLVLLGLGLLGFLRTPLYLHLPSVAYLASCTIIVLVFFALPRHQTMMKIAIVPFAAVGLSYLYSWLRLKLAKNRN